MNILGGLLREVRLKKGLSQTLVASRMGYSNNGYIATIEKGVYKPEDNTLKKYAQALEIPYEEILKLKNLALLQEANIFVNILSIPLVYDNAYHQNKFTKTSAYYPFSSEAPLNTTNNLFALKLETTYLYEARIIPGDVLIIDPDSPIYHGNIVIGFENNIPTLKVYNEFESFEESSRDKFDIIGKVIRKISVSSYE